MVYPENKAAADHFENLRSQFAEGVQRVRGKICFVYLCEKMSKLEFNFLILILNNLLNYLFQIYVTQQRTHQLS